MDVTFSGVPAYKGSNSFIFISYAHKDAKIVYKILSKMDSIGYKIWYDEGIDPGNEWGKDIANAILRCSVFTVFISNSSIVSDNVLDEINMAAAEGKMIVPIFIEDVELPPELKLKLSRRQAIMQFRMNEINFERKLNDIFLPELDQKVLLEEKMKPVQNQKVLSKYQKHIGLWGLAIIVLIILGMAIGMTLIKPILDQMSNQDDKQTKGNVSTTTSQETAQKDMTPSSASEVQTSVQKPVENPVEKPEQTPIEKAVQTPVEKPEQTSVVPTPSKTTKSSKMNSGTANTSSTETVKSTNTVSPNNDSKPATPSKPISTTVVLSTSLIDLSKLNEAEWKGPSKLMTYVVGSRTTFESQAAEGDEPHLLPWKIDQRPGVTYKDFRTTIVRKELPEYLSHINQISITGASMRMEDFYKSLQKAIQNNQGIFNFSEEEAAFSETSSADYYHQHYIGLIDNGSIKAIIGIKIDGTVHVKLY